MNVVLWDTRRNDVQKDFAGGMGVGMHPGTGGLRGKIVRHLYKQDYRPVAMNFAYLAAIVKKLGHNVSYSLDEVPQADVFIFNPALQTVDAERLVMQSIRKEQPNAKILVVGQVAFAMAESFAETGVTVVKGEAEQLLFKWDDVLNTETPIVNVGTVADLDSLPIPDWSLFNYKKFRINYDFYRFPSAYIQQSRGCTFKCNYCPYIMIESKTRFRDPDAITDEMRYGMKRYGFESFKFRDPLFGLNRKKALELAEGIRRLDRPVQFSVETRVDLMKEETLRALKSAGLTSITIGIETPDEATLKRYSRVAINDDRQRDFVALCRTLGIRTVAGFMVGFPEDTEASIRQVLNYARKVNPTYANFNIVTPYPGTPFYESVKDQIADHDLSKYSVYQPVMKYTNLTAAEVSKLHGDCFSKFYFRTRYLKDNGLLLWPGLRRFVPLHHGQPVAQNAEIGSDSGSNASRPHSAAA
ncbi:B12-binding domain-containing radical SAM protein [Mariniblastus sp.]|nr:B12-binding domain-containing radical SAM protein [Mariniblastus sp.]